MNETFGPSLNLTNYSNYDNVKQNIIEDDHIFLGGYIILGIFTPLILCLLFIIYIHIYDSCIIHCIKAIKKKNTKCYLYFESLNSPIVNNKLNKNYIKKLNASNKDKIKNNNDLQCSICIEDIKIKKTLVLDCGHAFCKDCLQTWVFKQISNGKKPDCPMCRQNIIRDKDIKKPNKYIVININYDSDSSDISDTPSYWD